MNNLSSIEIHPVSRPVNAEIPIPGSKSDTNRALIIAALADGSSVLTGALFSDDTRYMMASLQRLGFDVVSSGMEKTITVKGMAGRIPAGAADLFVGNAGTAMRFLTAFTALGHGRYRLDGVERMRQRPIQPLLDGLTQLGVTALSEGKNGCPPVIIESAGMEGGKIRMAGDRSSQYFTALLLIGPCTRHGVEIEVEGRMVSAPFIDLTASVMRRFGVDMINEDYQRLRVNGGQPYRAMTYAVEPDATAASYFFAAAAVTGGRARVNGLDRNSAQGDLRFVDALETMGCRVTRGNGFVEVTGPERLSGVDVDMNAISDTALTLAAIAPFADRPVTLRGLEHTRHQETDRIAAPVTELRRLGVRVDEHPDGMTIYPSSLRAGHVETYDDHRMAMSFALIGLRVPGIVILNPGCVSKTFPDYFDRLREISVTHRS
jgi:3-phosphoshikimate 1-carboxyvinyltransferase